MPSKQTQHKRKYKRGGNSRKNKSLFARAYRSTISFIQQTLHPSDTTNEQSTTGKRRVRVLVVPATAPSNNKTKKNK
jgi:hypothetical protein